MCDCPTCRALATPSTPVADLVEIVTARQDNTKTAEGPTLLTADATPDTRTL